MGLWDLLNLVLYCVQQLGVTLGVGAESVLLAAYIASMRDGVIEAAETRMAKAVHGVLRVGLVLIVVSGVAISALHILVGEMNTVFEPAYLFKWALIGVVVLLNIGINIKWPLTSAEGVAAGSWYALFLVHILAPYSTWINLAELYVVWMIGFVLSWEAVVYFMRGKSGALVPKVSPVIQSSRAYATPYATQVSQPKPIPSPPPPPKPVVAPPAPPPPPLPKPIPSPAVITTNRPTVTAPPNLPVAPKKEEAKIVEKVSDPDQNPELPAIRVMPKTPEDLQNQNRATLVKLD